ncbi:polyketide synthase [Spongiactinospora rosea]|uniref:Polyketide synthase n=2 Tax=Spongiactinospora rosea TaxID=2248750 RepID=A0A366M2N5_9ACTN|nr:polyketide synthase [Spongiactinospora rosea]
MATALYGREPVFTAAMDEFFEHLGAEGTRMRADWLSSTPRVPMDDASRAQPLLFAVGHALARDVMARGVRPVALLGHSVGELAAAAVADVFDLAGAARVMSARSAAMAEVSPGGLLAVAAAQDELAPYLGPAGDPAGVAVAAVNAPRHTVLAGPEPALREVERLLTQGRVPYRRVPSLQPFHCPALDSAARRFAAGFAGVPLRPPSVPIMSTRTAGIVRPGQAVDPAFWAGQLAGPVLFWPALDALLADGGYTLVEAGPGQGLSMLARRHPAVRRGRGAVIPLLPADAEGTTRVWHEALDRLAAHDPAAR